VGDDTWPSTSPTKSDAEAGRIEVPVGWPLLDPMQDVAESRRRGDAQRNRHQLARRRRSSLVLARVG
jgi:hypothetical protein